MNTAFADSVYWIAVVKPNDQWADAAKKARDSLGNARLITTDEVLTEFLAAMGSSGEKLREQAAKMVHAIIANANVKVIPQSRDSFLRGLDLYERRTDKSYSLTDCISMNAMRAEALTDILTNDHHFEQEGFAVLMKKQG
jgi:predicted nucleic acid-binding protein